MPMSVSKEGVEHIKRWEGYRRKAYQDVAGKWTIGYGHLIRLPYEQWLLDNEISEKLAENILREDIKAAEVCVNRLTTVTLEQSQFDMLVSFTFNLGCVALERSTMLFLLNQGDYEKAASQLLRWNKAGGKEVAGLTNRRKSEKEIWENGYT